MPRNGSGRMRSPVANRVRGNALLRSSRSRSASNTTRSRPSTVRHTALKAAMAVERLRVQFLAAPRVGRRLQRVAPAPAPSSHRLLARTTRLHRVKDGSEPSGSTKSPSSNGKDSRFSTCKPGVSTPWRYSFQCGRSGRHATVNRARWVRLLPLEPRCSGRVIRRAAATCVTLV